MQLRKWNALICVLGLLLLIGLGSPATAQSSNTPDKALAAAIDEVLKETFKPDEPGAAVIVVKDGKVIFRQGYGMANMELGVPMAPDMLFRLGSITKQFTAVAILMLAEQGKLAISDEVTKYLPDYPTQGHKITIEHLLTHTSGIKNYTALPEWRSQWRKDVTLKELIDLFKDKPMEFAPGERWNYSNSGYVLLGAIIEKVSGQSYQEFIEKNIFAPLGMKNSFYDDTARIIARRAAGYSKDKTGYRNAEYLSMTWPHAAGALMSTVDDLALWDAALYTEKLVKQESLKRAWTPYVLSSGKPTKYGYGWIISSVEGHRIIEHGGSINGFTTNAVRLPDDRVFVAILTNRDSGTGELGYKLAALAVGKRYKEAVATKLPPEALDKYIGVYQLNEKEDYVILKENDKLFLQHPVFGKVEILPLSETEFFIGERPASRINFIKGDSGQIISLVLRLGIAPDEEARKTDKPLPKPKEAVAVDPASYDGHAGEYELAPGLTITLTREENKLIAEATGRSKVELFPESGTKFFIKAVNAPHRALTATGQAASLILYQGGRKLSAKKIR